MEEELLRQILQEIQSQSGTSWQDVLLLSIPALVGLFVGLSGAAVAIYTVKRSSDNQLETLRLTTQAEVDKISLERRLDLRRDRYMELQNALAEFIAAADRMLDAKLRHAVAIFAGDATNQKDYLAIYENCRINFETVRSSGRLSEGRLKIGDQEIGHAVSMLAKDAERQYLNMNDYVFDTVTEFRESGKTPGGNGNWPEEHGTQRAEIANRTHQISEMIEERISLIT